MENMSFGEKGGNINNINNINAAPKAPRNKKLIWAGIVLAFFVVAVIAWQGWQYFNSPYYKQMKAAREFEKLFTDDKMGGKTPEETLAMFTEAVAKEDFDLASQYGIYGSRENIKKVLVEIKNNGSMNLLLNDLGRAKKVMTPDFGPDSLDFVVENEGKKYTILSMDKNKSNIWKITEF